MNPEWEELEWIRMQGNTTSWIKNENYLNYCNGPNDPHSSGQNLVYISENQNHVGCVLHFFYK